MSLLLPKQSARDLYDLARPVRHWIPLLLVVLVANAIFSSLSILMILPLLEYLAAGASPAMGAMGVGEGSSILLERIVALVGWLDFTDPFLGMCLLTIGAFALKAGFATLSVYTNAAFSERLRIYWVQQVAHRYLQAPYGSVVGRKHGVVANNIIREPTEAARFIKIFLHFLTNVAISIALVATMLIVEWQVVAIFVSASVALIVVLRKALFGFSMTLGQRNLGLSQQIVGAVHETVLAMKELRIQVAEGYREQYLIGIMARLGRNQISFQVLKDLPRSLGELFIVSIGLGLLVGAYYMLQGDFGGMLPKLAFLALAISRLFTVLSSLVSQRISYVNKLPSVRLVLDLVRDPALEQDGRERAAGSSRAPRIDGDIVFSDVEFAFEDGTQVLKGICCFFPHGRMTVLLGGSGGGKSTALDLLARLYRPAAGQITCGGRPIEEYALKDWRHRLGYVSQDPILFNGTIRENVLMGRDDISDEALRRAIASAGLDTFLRERELGWDAVVGNQGVALSGGQRKRVAIARAIAGDPDIIILDETTSSFEERLEQEILENIRRKRPDLTVIMITHRISSAAQADHVIVLENGSISASGSFDEVRESAERLASLDAPGSANEEEINLDDEQ